MKPCSNKREPIALLALRELDARQEQALRAHLQTCEGCRRYLEQISSLTDALAAAETNPDLQASESFHGKVMARLLAEEPASPWETARLFLRRSLFDWRVALPVAAAAAALILALSVPRHPPAAPALPSPQAMADLPPTIANYQMAAGQSLQTLDDFLARQAQKPLPPAPLYTASTLTLPDTPD
jgi:anti-sigma-K factor RskA